LSAAAYTCADMNNSPTTPAAIRWRMRRGMRELDMIMTRWFDARYDAAPEPERQAFLDLLDIEDPDLWAWLMGHSPAPEGRLSELIEQLREYR
jgi:antitoxin CptB